MTSVSIAMATYNGEPHIRRQLESITGQVYPPSELVVSDDGSDDATLSILADFAAHSRFPVHIHKNKSRLGWRANFMRASNLCKSELIALCDQDDIWYPRKIAICVERFSGPDILLVYHNADIITDRGLQIGRVHEFAPAQKLTSGPTAFVPGFTEMFRRSLLRFSNLWANSLDYLGFDVPLSHDQYFFFLASALGRVVYIDEPLAAYVQHRHNTVGWKGHRRQLRSALTNHGIAYSHFAKSLDRCGVILNSIEKDLNGACAQRAGIAAENYRKLSEVYAIRSTIYKSTKFDERLKAFRKIFAQGGYNDEWSVGRISLLKDICLGVTIGPFLRSPNET